MTLTQDKSSRQYPRLLASEGSENQKVKFQKIEMLDKFLRKVETSFVLKSLHKTNSEIHSFRLIKIQDAPFRQRRKSECDGVVSEKIQNIDMKYPKTTIEQHQFLDRVKDLRRRAIKGRMKTKFQKSFKKIDTTKPSQFNPQHQHTMSTRDSIFGSLQDIKVYRTFAKDRPYYQRPLEKKGSDLMSDSPSTPSFHIRRVTQKLGFASKQQQFVLLQLNKYNPKIFEQLKKDSILKILSETKETQPQTPAPPQTASTIQHKFQPYFCHHKTMNLKKSCIASSSQRLKTVF
ncbi:unnamed protein product (macronuclear) [Paramecium tetraurelia]|uniref:Uncharacterized protein n=1 Tax=Paramecium tetraurelia TaxID=5888 RepID=A0C4P6_PARTE|nr:uncharacterized protein GSPATT00006262001 [Paramecium tetraurelia]CAK65763.1 unnamed protein product [Paramecium tetraurelia]|eukprot:XP_001433160.1 hypothetical protein (macronuclear) [Paramecium tetraurelia strain d4-2]